MQKRLKNTALHGVWFDKISAEVRTQIWSLYFANIWNPEAASQKTLLCWCVKLPESFVVFYFLLLLNEPVTAASFVHEDRLEDESDLVFTIVWARNGLDVSRGPGCSWVVDNNHASHPTLDLWCKHSRNVLWTSVKSRGSKPLRRSQI